MDKQIVKILDTSFITHDVKRFVVEKPQGFSFIPGQAADVSINLKKWQNEKRPFTFTGLNAWNYLEFMIKIYRDRHGVTDKLESINAGDELILHDVFGTIRYKGPGVFIAGGAGITPFISIIRDLNQRSELSGNKLIFSNKRSDDVILDKELEDMLHDDFVKIFTREKVIGFIYRKIDRDFLIEHISNFNQRFYICGPDKFISDIKAILKDLGASAESLVVEE